MLPFIQENILLWHYLKTTDKPVVLYGTGDGADKVIARLAAENVAIAGVFASDEFVRGQKFCGHTVRKYSELMSAKTQLIVLICFASERPEQLERFYRLAQAQETYAPHVPVFAGDAVTDFAWLAAHEREIQSVYDRLADDVSREVFAAVMNYRVSGKMAYLRECTTNRAEDMDSLFTFGMTETYVDTGAFTGDTVEEFLRLTDGNYKKIFAVEPDPKNFAKLTAYIRNRRLDKIEIIQAGAWNSSGSMVLKGNGGRQSTLYNPTEGPIHFETTPQGQKSEMVNRSWAVSAKSKAVKKQKVRIRTLDSVLGDIHADYIKFDVEGVEKEAIEGLEKHLIPDTNGVLPKLLIAAYHHDEDIFALPLLLWKIQPEYKIFLRKHPYIPAWEINIFAK